MPGRAEHGQVRMAGLLDQHRCRVVVVAHGLDLYAGDLIRGVLRGGQDLRPALRQLLAQLRRRRPRADVQAGQAERVDQPKGGVPMRRVPRAPPDRRERRFGSIYSHHDRIVLRNDVVHRFLSLVLDRSGVPWSACVLRLLAAVMRQLLSASVTPSTVLASALTTARSAASAKAP